MDYPTNAIISLIIGYDNEALTKAMVLSLGRFHTVKAGESTFDREALSRDDDVAGRIRDMIARWHYFWKLCMKISPEHRRNPGNDIKIKARLISEWVMATAVRCIIQEGHPSDDSIKLEGYEDQLNDVLDGMRPRGPNDATPFEQRVIQFVRTEYDELYEPLGTLFKPKVRTHRPNKMLTDAIIDAPTETLMALASGFEDEHLSKYIMEGLAMFHESTAGQNVFWRRVYSKDKTEDLLLRWFNAFHFKRVNDIRKDKFGSLFDELEKSEKAKIDPKSRERKEFEKKQEEHERQRDARQCAQRERIMSLAMEEHIIKQEAESIRDAIRLSLKHLKSKVEPAKAAYIAEFRETVDDMLQRTI